MSGVIIYYPNSIDLAKSLILPHNGISITKESVWPNNLIYLVKMLIIYLISIFINYFKCTHIMFTVTFICSNVGSELSKEIGYDISGYAGCLLSTFY